MNADHDENACYDQAVVLLAKQSNVPVDHVARLYEGELTRLEVDAHIAHFVPIFAIRNVREMLRVATREVGSLVQPMTRKPDGKEPTTP